MGASRFLAERYGITREEFFNFAWDIDPKEVLTRELDPEILRKLTEGGRKAVLLTSAPKVWAERVLDFLGVKGLFEEIICAEDFGIKDEILGRFAERYKPVNITSIGDQEKSDIDPARKRGMNGVLVRGPDDLERLLIQLLPEYENQIRSQLVNEYGTCEVVRTDSGSILFRAGGFVFKFLTESPRLRLNPQEELITALAGVYDPTTEIVEVVGFRLAKSEEFDVTLSELLREKSQYMTEDELLVVLRPIIDSLVSKLKAFYAQPRESIGDKNPENEIVAILNYLSGKGYELPLPNLDSAVVSPVLRDLWPGNVGIRRGSAFIYDPNPSLAPELAPFLEESGFRYSPIGFSFLDLGRFQASLEREALILENRGMVQIASYLRKVQEQIYDISRNLNGEKPADLGVGMNAALFLVCQCGRCQSGLQQEGMRRYLESFENVCY